MNRSFSAYLDAARFAAAMVVLLSHWAYERFTGGAYIWIRDYNLGSDAVVVFFVLSGLVIAYTADTKDRTAGAYLFSRATRIFSVAAPALALTFVLDRLGAHLNPPAYGGWWYEPLGALGMFWHGLSFSSEWSIPGTRLGSNGPYWSLSYEVAYYLLFAAALFLSGIRRVVVLATLCALVGVKVLLLLPVWLTGVFLWGAFRNLKPAAAPLPLAIALMALPAAAYMLCLALGIPHELWLATVHALGVEPGLLAAVLGFSDEFAWNLLVGLLFGIHLFAVWRFTGARLRPHAGVGTAAIRWLAGASFSIYLVHYPIMQFTEAVLPEALPLRDAALLAATVAACFLFAQAFERPLPELRAALRRMTAPSRAGPLQAMPAPTHASD